jgi:Tfp pilus assembly protein PilP
MTAKPRSSRLACAIVLALSMPLLAACGRSITSSPGDAPNLEVWAAQVKAKKPTAKHAALPLLKERAVFNYADNTILTLNPNPQAALDAAMANGQQSPSADPTSPPVLDMLRLAAKGGKSDAAVNEAAYANYLSAWKAASDYFGLNRNDVVAAKSFLDKLDAASSHSGMTGADLTPEEVAAGAAAATPPGASLPEVRMVEADPLAAPASSAPSVSEVAPEKAAAPAAKPVTGKSAPADAVPETKKSEAPNAEAPKAESSKPDPAQASLRFKPVHGLAGLSADASVGLWAAPTAQERRRDRRKDADATQEEVTLPQLPSDQVLPTSSTSAGSQVSPSADADLPKAEVSAVELARLFADNAYNLRRAGFDLEQALAFLAVSPSLAPGVAQEFALAGPDTNRHLFDLATGRRVSPVDVLILASNEGAGIDSLPASTAIATFRTDNGAARLKSMDAALRGVGGGEAIRFLVADRATRKPLRNPFDLPSLDDTAMAVSAATTRPDPLRPRQILEQFSLDSLTMMGTMGEGSSMTALVRAPDRTVYRVHLGQYLGQNDGRVVNIDNGGMDLVELVQDGANGWTEQPASLLLAE